MPIYDNFCKNENITVVIVSWYSAKFITKQIKNLLRKAANPTRIEFLIIDNTDGQDQEIAGLCGKWARVAFLSINTEGNTGSCGHAIGLNHGTARSTTKYTLIIDPDVYLFKNGWDTFLISELLTKGAIAIGAPYPWWKLGKYHDFPSPPFIFFDTHALRSLGEDWTPFSGNSIRRRYNFLALLLVRIYRVGTRKRLMENNLLRKICQTLESIFGVCSPDTGWLIARAARRAGARSIVFKEVNNQDAFLRNFGKLSAVKCLAQEYELFYYKEQPILVHKYSTYSYHWSTNRGSDDVFYWNCIKKFEKEITKNKQSR